MSNASYVLRTLYIDPKLDERLKREAYVANISKNELIRKYLEIGISSVDEGGHPQVSKPVVGYKASDASPSASSVASDLTLLRHVTSRTANPTAVKNRHVTKVVKKAAKKAAKKATARKATKAPTKKVATRKTEAA